MLFTPAVPPLGTRYKLNVRVLESLLQKYIVVTASPWVPVLVKILVASVAGNALLVIAIFNPYNTSEYTMLLRCVANSLF